MSELKINTAGWVDIHCDQCGTTNSYDPEYAKTMTECFGCMVKKYPEGRPPS